VPQLPTSNLSDADETYIHNAWGTMVKVLERLRAKGVLLPEAPPSFPIPEVTSTLVEGDNQEYLKTNSRYLAWLNYLLPHLALVRGVLLEVSNEKTNIGALYRQSTKEADTRAGRKKATKEEIDDAITLDPRYIELTQIEQEMSQEKYLLEAKLEELERTLRVISRHVEVKKMDMEMNKVGLGLPQRHPYNFGR
jgi:hypothetical protein